MFSGAFFIFFLISMNFYRHTLHTCYYLPFKLCSLLFLDIQKTKESGTNVYLQQAEHFFDWLFVKLSVMC